MIINVNGRTLTLGDTYLVSPEAKKMLLAKYNSNGCGTNLFNRSIITLITKWSKVDLTAMCYLHDAEYDVIKRDLVPPEDQYRDKAIADLNLHLNVFYYCVEQGLTLKKAAIVARLFHSAVLLFGHKSAGLDKHIRRNINNRDT